MQKEKINKLIDILNYSTGLLQEKGIDDARLNVELMLCEILKCDRMKLYLDFDKPLKEAEIADYKALLLRRLKNEPLQYILGKTNFYGYEIKVNKDVLIPRQETELLVERLIEDIKSKKTDDLKIIEIGTGSGCIAIALSKELEKINIKYQITSIDISNEAINLAKENAIINNADIDFRIDDFLKINEFKYDYDLLVMNPPYIREKDIKALMDEVKDYEPINSLTDRNDGLTFYRKAFNLYKIMKHKFSIYVEIGFDQKIELSKLLAEYDITNFRFLKDYNEKDRILIIDKC